MPTPALKAAAFAPETQDAIIPLLTITHSMLPMALRFARNLQDITSRGEVYLGCSFDIELPWQDSERPPKSTLRIDNVNRVIVETLRSIQGPPLVVLEVVLASDTDVVESGPFYFTLRNVEYDIVTVSGDLTFLEVLGRRFPKGTYNPSTFPGIF